jgi:hypothetical protein
MIGIIASLLVIEAAEYLTQIPNKRNAAGLISEMILFLFISYPPCNSKASILRNREIPVFPGPLPEVAYFSPAKR